MVRPLREVHVERGDDGVLVVHWEADPGTAVDVGTGISPVVSEHVRFGRATRSTSVRFTGLGRHRRFVSLTMPGGRPVVVAERRLAFAGITNFRDLGGYPTIDGGTTCWGRVFRADALHKLTVADLVAFHDLGVRTVFDLRGEVERSDFPGPIESVHVPIYGGVETYLAGPAELTAGELASLRECLTVAPRHHAVDIVDGSRSTRPAAARNPGSTTGCR